MNVISRTCILCKTPQSLTVDMEKYLLWKSGVGHIQNMLPTLSIGEREILISGICSTCFDKSFEEE